MRTPSFPQLRWTTPQGEEQEYPVQNQETTLGRSSQSDIALLDRFTSRQHAKILVAEDGYSIVDLDSKQGTFVNEERVTEKILNHGDQIRLGHIELVFLTGPKQPTEPASIDITAEGNLERSLREFESVVASPKYAQASELEKVSHILDFQYQWGQSFSFKLALRQILRSALQISGAERGFVLVKEEDDLAYSLGLDSAENVLPEANFHTSHTVVDQVLAQDSAVFFTQGITGELAQQESVLELQLRSIACLPLRGISLESQEGQILGILYLDSTHRMNTLSQLEQKILEKLAMEAGGVLEKLELIKGIEEREKFARELETAHEIQRRLLPRSLPELPEFQISAFSEPSRQVGGDFYDFLQIQPGKFLGVLADASGKGMPAALMSSLLQGGLDMGCRAGEELETVVDQVNRMLWERSRSRSFATMFCFCLNTEGEGTYVSAGHNPAYLLRASSGGIHELESTGLILGAFDFASYQSGRLKLNSGDVLMVYSDGLVEAESPNGEMFGEERLQAILQEDKGVEVSALKEKILHSIEEFTQGAPQTDDMTLVLLRYFGNTRADTSH